MSEDIKAAIASAMKSVTRSWKQVKRQADRDDRVSRSRVQRMRDRPPSVTIRDAAFAAMERAYMKASSNGKFYANARQIMYAARPEILESIDAAYFNDVYFTQTLIKDYLDEYEPGWRVVWDARGHLVEPHTGAKVSLGGIGVRRYIDGWHSTIERDVPEFESMVDTKGPDNRFSSVLFIEKEGFAEILTHAGIGERYDMAIMSTKGLPVKAACDLIETMHRKGVKTFVLRDFDEAGFKIMRSLSTGVRRASGSPVIDLGLRLEDIEGLTSEPVTYKRSKNPRWYLESCGATDDEIAFLVHGSLGGSWHGERVEINAMTSEQLIAWLEMKFQEHGIQQLVPETNTLNDAYRRAICLQRMQAKIAEFKAEKQDDDIDVPKRLPARVEALRKKNPKMSWDQAVWELAEEDS